MLDIASSFYKNLFCSVDRSGFSLGDNFFNPEEIISEDQNTLLEAPFSEEEIKKAVFSSYLDGAPGPDGFSFMFYQKCWNIIKTDVLALFQDFFVGKLDLFRLNFVVLSLIPKEARASSMKKFRPISLLNCIFKIFTKVITTRFGLIMDKLIAPNQTAFIKGRYILDSVVTAHEVLHSVHHGKEEGVVLKLDYEKAFDEVDLNLLDDLLLKRGFGPKIRKWISMAIRGGSVAVKINNTQGGFFVTFKGLRQGDPLSPILFYLVVDVFTRMLSRSAFLGLIRGLCKNFCPGGVISLQYADDTILFLENNRDTARNMKLILTCFEQVSGMRINYSKSELVPINLCEEDVAELKLVFGCIVGSFPIKYLGSPSIMINSEGRTCNL